MKKLISLVVVLVFVTCLVPAAFAADAGLSASSATAAPGEEVSLTVSVSEATFATYLVELDYDSSVLEYVSSEGSFGLFSGSADAAGSIGTADSAYGGPLFTVTFKVAEGAAGGEYPVSVIVDNFTKADGVTGVSVSGATGVVTVVAPHEHAFGNWQYDEDSHWRECECGEQADFDEHDFVEGVCSVCGYEEVVVTPEPTVKPEDPEPTVKPEDPKPTQKPVVDPNKSPKTGDDAPIVLLAVMLTVCAAGVAVVLATKKSKASK